MMRMREGLRKMIMRVTSSTMAKKKRYQLIHWIRKTRQRKLSLSHRKKSVRVKRTYMIH